MTREEIKQIAILTSKLLKEEMKPIKSLLKKQTIHITKLNEEIQSLRGAQLISEKSDVMTDTAILNEENEPISNLLDPSTKKLDFLRNMVSEEAIASVSRASSSTEQISEQAFDRNTKFDESTTAGKAANAMFKKDYSKLLDKMGI